MKSGRYEAVDALRGVIMMIMAIDHASAFIARQHGSEFWAGALSAYDSAFPFLTRWITHLCAPGFFFLMGAGAYWMLAAWRESGRQDGAAVKRLAWRGFAIFAVAQVLELPVLFLTTQLKPAAVSLSRTTAPLPNDGSSLLWGFITLTGLGLVLISCAALLRLAPGWWLGVSAACTVATHVLLPASANPGTWWNALLLAPGLAQHLLVLYPAIPWLGVAAAGMYFGFWWKRDSEKAEGQVWLVGLVLLAVGVALRAYGGLGNIRPPRDGGWIEFLNNVKYPPSLVFSTIAIGLNLVLLWVLAKLPTAVRGPRSPLVVFGQTPLFFYLAHFYALAASAFLLFGEAGSLELAYAVWAAVLVALYPVCAWYRRFKMGKPRESLWRMF
ncbi:MAG: heparan-alpha-glucosaminide N-acetyltransferase domain-containing protein [Bryobacteraceae bacterium]|nr:heparan-alpha-glucosaminide N-acetyltransferase domain-containing protein [Bryobacteraceae bacterium]